MPPGPPRSGGTPLLTGGLTHPLSRKIKGFTHRLKYILVGGSIQQSEVQYSIHEAAFGDTGLFRCVLRVLHGYVGGKLLVGIWLQGLEAGICDVLYC
jgi:hypothetical protein